MTIEESFKQLDGIIEILENRDTPIEEAFSQYEKGIKLIKECSDNLNKVEEKILILQQNGEKEANKNEF